MRIYCVFILSILLFSCLFGQGIPDWISTYDIGLQLIHEDRFDSAVTLFNTLDDEFKAGLGVTITYFHYSKDMEDTSYLRRASIAMPIKDFDKIDPKNSNKWDVLAYGVALTYKSFIEGAYYTHTGKIKYALNCKKYSDRAIKVLEHIENDTGVGPEASAMLGNLWYWISSRGEILRKFGLIKDAREKGINALHKSSRRARIFEDFASYSLAMSLLDYGKIDESQRILKSVMGKYPNTRCTEWTLLFIYLTQEKCIESLEIIDKLYKFYEGKSDINCASLAKYGYLCAEFEGLYEKEEFYRAQYDNLIKNKYIKSVLKRSGNEDL